MPHLVMLEISPLLPFYSSTRPCQNIRHLPLTLSFTTGLPPQHSLRESYFFALSETSAGRPPVPLYGINLREQYIPLLLGVVFLHPNSQSLYQEPPYIDCGRHKMSKHSSGCSHASRERHRCPVCNSGSGREKCPYTSRNGTIEPASPPTSSSSSSSPKVYAGEFQLSTAFDRHIIDWHEKIFASIYTHEYICALCPCKRVTHGLVDCSARFSARPSNKQEFLDHLRTAHAGAEQVPMWYTHYCSPPKDASYLDPVVGHKAKSLA